MACRVSFTILLGLLVAPAARSADVTYFFEDNDRDEVFNVSVEVTGGSFGLATYNVAVSGLGAAPFSLADIVWEENVLGNINTASQETGFNLGRLFFGADGWAAVNTQFQQPNPVFGVGQTPVFVEALVPGLPGNADIDLGVPALLGRLTLPGANTLTDAELHAFLSPNAALFASMSSVDVENADSVAAVVVRLVPEPAAALLAVAAFGVAARRRRC